MELISRRRFLEISAATFGAVAVPFPVPVCADARRLTRSMRANRCRMQRGAERKGDARSGAKHEG